MKGNKGEEHRVFSIPKFTMNRTDVEGFLDERKGFHEAFRDCFSRSEPRENFFRYRVGQFSELERKSVELIALTGEGGNVRSMQRMVSDAQWDEDLFLQRYHRLVGEDLGDDEGILIFDETSFVKKGDDSIGVARQYCGSLGKGENCQVGVFTAYASPDGYALLDKRLFIPEKWFSEPYQERRLKCRLPETTVFQTKVELAVEMLEQICTEGILPFRYVVADGGYGKSIDFIPAAEKHPGVVYFLAVPSDTLCWLKPPVTEERVYTYGGERRSKTILSETERAPVTASSFALNLNSYFWYRRPGFGGHQGTDRL